MAPAPTASFPVSTSGGFGGSRAENAVALRLWAQRTWARRTWASRSAGIGQRRLNPSSISMMPSSSSMDMGWLTQASSSSRVRRRSESFRARASASAVNGGFLSHLAPIIPLQRAPCGASPRGADVFGVLWPGGDALGSGEIIEARDDDLDARRELEYAACKELGLPIGSGVVARVPVLLGCLAIKAAAL